MSGYYGFVDEEAAHEFHDELVMLLERYHDRMTAHPADGDELDELRAEGFDPDAPDAITGIVMIVTRTKLDGEWQQSYHYRPPAQDRWMSLGLAADLHEWWRCFVCH